MTAAVHDSQVVDDALDPDNTASEVDLACGQYRLV
jgi:hypothetical protein